MHFEVLDQYPGMAAKGADYISGAAVGEITEHRPTGPVVRREQVITTGIEIDGEGMLCFGERTVRHMAHLFKMYDGWQVDALKALLTQTSDDRDLVSRDLADAREENDRLRAMLAEPEVREVFVALDGTKHASAAAAENTSRKARGKQARGVAETTPAPDVKVGA